MMIYITDITPHRIPTPAGSPLPLVIARFVQGFGGAGAVSAIVAIIAAEFPRRASGPRR
jgi:MFS family permease